MFWQAALVVILVVEGPVLPLGPPQAGELSEQVIAKAIAGAANRPAKIDKKTNDFFSGIRCFFRLFIFLIGYYELYHNFGLAL